MEASGNQFKMDQNSKLIPRLTEKNHFFTIELFGSDGLAWPPANSGFVTWTFCPAFIPACEGIYSKGTHDRPFSKNVA